MPVQTTSSKTLDGCWFLITGASSGIGNAIALSLAQRGAGIIAVGRDDKRLMAMASEFNIGTLYQHISADLTVPEEMSAVLAKVQSLSQPLDGVIHSAGTVTLGPVADIDIAALDLQYQLNFRVPFLLTQNLIPYLRPNSAQILFINSIAGLRANPNWGSYAASKYALRALADSLREELRPKGVRVVSLYPGRTHSPMQQAIHKSESRAYDASRLIQPEHIANLVTTIIELPETTEVSDITIRPTAF